MLKFGSFGVLDEPDPQDRCSRLFYSGTHVLADRLTFRTNITRHYWSKPRGWWHT